MTWTYNVSDLSTSEKDQIRLELGDTDVNNPFLQDEEIAQAITVERDFWGASARCSEMIARKLLLKADVKLGRALSIQYTKAADQWFQMARRLRMKSSGSVVPYVGGMSITDKETISGDTDVVAPQFTKTMMENPRAGGYSSDSTSPSGATGEPGTDDDEDEF